ncbi:hypothetical protein J5X84_07460 [Streptosporangiaceae bacterium NEAU-GS5]|nr:hypothetical protein [Streptosporangiaceae bacterium NEAU-GS5]
MGTVTVTGWPGETDVPESSLSLGRKLGTGGQGAVHELTGRGTGHVYKEYLNPAAVDGRELAMLVDTPKAMTAMDRDRLLRQCAWPLARVVDGTRVKGFIMAMVPQAFWAKQQNGPKLREYQYLLFEPKKMWGDIVPPDVDGRLDVVRQVVDLFRLLHGNKLIVGDVSMSNILWTDNPGGVYLLDCDAIRKQGRRPVMAQPETPDWDDPLQPPDDPDLDTDRYKLALLVVRALTRNSRLRPGEPMNFVPGVPERIAKEVTARFQEAARPRGLRPDAAQWALAVSERGTIDLGPLPTVRTAPNLRKAPIDGAPDQRPLIQLKPPGSGR